MNPNTLNEILHLPVAERLQVLELIWQSIPDGHDDFQLSPELEAELDDRIREFEANPDCGVSWENVEASVRDGSWRTA